MKQSRIRVPVPVILEKTHLILQIVPLHILQSFLDLFVFCPCFLCVLSFFKQELISMMFFLPLVKFLELMVQLNLRQY